MCARVPPPTVGHNGGTRPEEDTMPRYVVERSFPDGLSMPVDDEGAKASLAIVDGNAAEGVTWITRT